MQQFIFDFYDGTDTLEQTCTIIYCKQLPLLSAADLDNLTPSPKSILLH